LDPDSFPGRSALEREMRNSNLIVSATVAISAILGLGAASAADMAQRYTKAPATASIYNWTGFYIGADVGGAWGPDISETTIDTNGGGFDPNTFGRGSTSAVIGGLYAGYNWQWNSPLVLGVEADISATSLKNSNSLSPAIAGGAPIPATTMSASENVKWLASARGRIGYAADKVLLYVTGGAAWTSVDYKGSLAALGGETAAVSFNRTKTGWVAGGGVEWAFMPNVSLRAEYLYYGFDGAAATGFFLPAPCHGCTGPVNFSWSSGDVQSARVGIAYKFGGPVVAQY
jgi:outer membrane immunogenic protein